MDRMIAKAKAVSALGLLTDDSTPFGVSQIFSAILNDKLVNERALALGFEEGTCVMLADYEDYADIVTAMTPAERQSLRERLAQ